MTRNPMKRFMISILKVSVVIVLSQNIYAQSPDFSDAEWKMKYDFSQTREKFSEPPLFYAPHIFWFWDKALDTVQISDMAGEMTRQRLNPGYVHARSSDAPTSVFSALPKYLQWYSGLW